MEKCQVVVLVYVADLVIPSSTEDEVNRVKGKPRSLFNLIELAEIDHISE